MTTDELSWEETNRLYRLSLVPTFVIFFTILIYLNYLMYTNPLRTFWDFITRVAWLYTLLPIAFFITFEFAYSKKTRRPFTSHSKRLLGRLFVVSLGTLSFFGFLIVTQPALYPLMGDWAGVVGSFLWVVIFTLVVIRFRETLVKMDSGKW